MSETQRRELADILFSEIETYLPEIDRSIAVLSGSRADETTLSETYRLFHNIKGAASQVEFTDLSRSAALCEVVLSGAMESARTLADSHLTFLDAAHTSIRDFCARNNRSEEAEQQLLAATKQHFQEMLDTEGADNPLTIPEYIYDWFGELKLPSRTAAGGNDRLARLESNRQQCLVSLRTIIPLLQELAEVSSRSVPTTFSSTVLRPMVSAVSTLLACSHSAELRAQEQLLADYLLLIKTLQANPQLVNEETPALLGEFLAYLDIVFSLPPDEGEVAVSRIKGSLATLTGLLTTGSVPAPSSPPQPVVDDNQPQLDLDEFSAIDADELFADFGDEFAPDKLLDTTSFEDTAELFSDEQELLDSPLLLAEDDLEPADTSPVTTPSSSLVMDEFMDELAPMPAGELFAESDAASAATDEAHGDTDTASEIDGTLDALFAEPEDIPPASVLQPAVELSEEEQELLAIFQAECDEHLQVIGAELVNLEHGVRPDGSLTAGLTGSLGAMRRAVHTLKGAAAMTGFDDIAGCAHTLEDLLDWLHDEARSLTQPSIEVVAQAIDTIETLAQSPAASSSEDVATSNDLVRQHLTQLQEQQPPAPEEIAVQDEPSSLESEATSSARQEMTELIEETPEEDAIDTLPVATGNVRVRLEDLDEIVNLEGELVMARGSIERLLDRFGQSLADLQTVKDALQRKSQELEVGFEAQSLYGFGPARGPGNGLPFMEQAPGLAEFDPIELDRYSQLNLIIRSLNEISIDVNALHGEMTSLASEVKGQVAKQQLAMGVMQEKLMRIRMTPLSTISRALFRTVRQTAAKLDKKVQLTIEGEEVYMDRFIWSRTIDPLMHILRNCIDHGIESSEERQSANKPATGRITLKALQQSRHVVLQITDDGRGIDFTTLRHKLIREGLIGADDPRHDEELLPFLFRPSVSTRDDISQISGRGVGLDVVLKNIQELRGNVQVYNRPGEGVTFELSIPITLSVNRAIIVNSGDSQFAVPLQDIVEIRKFAKHEITTGDEATTVLWNGQQVDLIELGARLHHTDSREAIQPMRPVLVISTGTEHHALQVDGVLEQREIVIKDLGSHLRYVRGISGATLTGEGDIIPILNIREIVTQEDELVGLSSPAVTPEEEAERTLQVLIVDDSISVRHSISRLIKGQGWYAEQAVDGLDALEKLDHFNPDLIILDIEMPRMNGYEFMATLRNDERRRDIPVVMLTSRASEKHRQKAEELGVNHYLTKPYQEDAFLQLLRAMHSTAVH